MTENEARADACFALKAVHPSRNNASRNTMSTALQRTVLQRVRSNGYSFEQHPSSEAWRDISYAMVGRDVKSSTSGNALGPRPSSTWRAVSIADSGIPVHNQLKTQRREMKNLTSKARHLQCMGLPIDSPLQPMYI